MVELESLFSSRLLGDPVGGRIMARVAGDEPLHHVFYWDFASAAIAIDPSTMMLAMERQVRGFVMLGVGLPDLARRARDRGRWRVRLRVTP